MPLPEYDRKRAMKRKDIRPCARCGKGVMHTGLPLFYRVTIERMGVDVPAVESHAGLEAFFGGARNRGAIALANVMGVDADLCIPLGPLATGLLCENCASDHKVCFGEIAEAISSKGDDDARED